MAQAPSLGDDVSDSTEKVMEETGVTYAPSLLIGLGGTGAEVLLRVKKQLQDRAFEDTAPLRFLFIDTDRDTFSPSKGLPDIEDKEECFIGKDKAGKFMAQKDAEGMFSALKRRFPEKHLNRSNIDNLSMGSGASQIRSLGAFAVALQAGFLKNKLVQAYNDVTDLEKIEEAKAGNSKIEIRDQVYIYLVGSLAGGTGSGGFLDVGLLSKHVCGVDDPKLIGMFALPEVFDSEVNESEQKTNTRANTYAALKELQFCLDTDREERKKIGTIPFEYDTDAIEQELHLEPHDSLFDLCFLVGERNSKGKLSGVDDLYSLMARSLLHDVGSQFGASARSFESNISVLNEVSVCPKTGLERLFGTISTSALHYPASRVADYCTLRTAESVVQDHLIGASPSEETLRTRLSDFLERQDLDNRGEANQLLESLLRTENPNSLDPAPESGEPISRDRFALPFDYGKELGVEEFARQIQNQWSDFSGKTLPKIKALIDQNRGHRIGEEGDQQDTFLGTAIEDLALSTAAEHGARAAQEILEMLEEVAEKMQDEFREESDEWEERKEWLAQEFTDSTDELKQVGTIKALFTSEDEDLKKHLIEHYGELVGGKLRELARPSALQILEKLGKKAKNLGTKWGNLVTELMKLRKALRGKADDEETSRSKSGFAVDRDITLPGHERRYYREFHESELSSEEAFDVVLGTYDGASNSRAELFRDALQQDVVMFGEEALIDPLYDHIEGPIFDTDIVEFAQNNPEEVVENGGENALKRKLDFQSDLCQPFWPAETLEADEFPDFKGISAPEKSFKDDGSPVYPPLIEEWKETHKYSGIPSTSKREIVLSRRTYGARAFYLKGIRGWKSKYNLRQEESEGKYMTETHVRMKKIPDIFPSDDKDKPTRLFALGMALGFIVQRGDWYYFGLRKEDSEEKPIKVLYQEQDWKSIYSLNDLEEPTSDIGNIDFSKRRDKVNRDEHRLGHGRKSSLEEFEKSDKMISMTKEAVDEYHKSVGNKRFRNELGEYLEFLKDKKLDKKTDIYDDEIDGIREKKYNIGG